MNIISTSSDRFLVPTHFPLAIERFPLTRVELPVRLCSSVLNFTSAIPATGWYNLSKEFVYVFAYTGLNTGRFT